MTESAAPGNVHTPFLLAIEGIDGAGKTTLARLFADALSHCGFDVVLSKEPTQGQFGQKLRQSAATGRMDPELELDLLLRDRREHIEQLVGPALDGGKIVVLDRYYFSNAAYQGAEGLNPTSILAANESFAPRADLVILLDTAPETGLGRVRSRGDLPNYFENRDTLARCRDIFNSIDRPELRKVDASKTIDGVFSNSMHLFVIEFAEKMRQLHGFSVDAAETLLPLLHGAYREHARAHA